MTMSSATTRVTYQQWRSDLLWSLTSPLMTVLEKYHPTLPQLMPYQSPEQSHWQTVNTVTGLDDCFCNETPPRLSSHFLGPYFEQCWLRLINKSNNLNLLAHNLQIHHAGVTLGEFDFLVRETITERVIHQELAIKFYLGLPVSTADGLRSVWFGPNQMDRLDLKLNAMINRQVQLSKQVQARKFLSEMNSSPIAPSTSISTEIVCKGYLFQPYQQSLPLPAYVNPDSLSGEWLPRSLMPALMGRYDGWVILPKLQWLAVGNHHQRIKTDAELIKITSFETGFRPLLVAALIRVADNKFREIKRYFIVGDDWQSQALGHLARTPIKAIHS